MAQHTVLVVEDDASIRSLIAELLDDAGYRVLEADCGKMALSLAREHAPSVALVDYMLPDMSGLDVLERLRGYLKSGMRAAPPAGREVRHGERAGGARVVADDLAGAG